MAAAFGVEASVVVWAAAFVVADAAKLGGEDEAGEAEAEAGAGVLPQRSRRCPITATTAATTTTAVGGGATAIAGGE